MTDIEAKALALVNEVRTERGGDSYTHYTRLNRSLDAMHEALCRAIERHEAYKQEVSDAVEKAQAPMEITCQCARKHVVALNLLDHLVIPKPKPDPLVAAMKKMGWYLSESFLTDAENFRAALDALGFEIREKGQ
jgi:histidyl-tRNA synthetase